MQMAGEKQLGEQHDSQVSDLGSPSYGILEWQAIWLEGEAGDLGESHVISLWTMGFAVPVGKLSDADIQWEGVSPNLKYQVKFIFRENRFRKWSLICSGQEQQVRAKIQGLGGEDDLKHLRRRGISTAIFFLTQFFTYRGSSITICVFYQLVKK